MNDYEIRIPDIEIIIGCSGDDLAVFAFYRREDIHQGYEIVSAIAGQASRSVIKQILKDAITAVDAEDWYTLEQLHQVDDEEVDGEPF